MGDMIAHGILTPSGPFGHETGVMRVCGKDDIMVTYNQVKYCPFCGREIKVIQQ
jgi:ribosomal protein L37AE/L43A